MSSFGWLVIERQLFVICDLIISTCAECSLSVDCRQFQFSSFPFDIRLLCSAQNTWCHKMEMECFSKVRLNREGRVYSGLFQASRFFYRLFQASERICSRLSFVLVWRYTMFSVFSNIVKKKHSKARRIYFAKYTLEKWTLEIKIWKLLVIDFRQYITSRGLRKLCNGPETPTQWKSERGRWMIDGLIGVGARDAYASKNFNGNSWKTSHYSEKWTMFSKHGSPIDANSVFASGILFFRRNFPNIEEEYA